MKIISTNIGEKRTVKWKNKTMTTGIYKLPVDEPIYLDHRGVEGDHINNLKVHGGIDKACYAYGENYYAYWKDMYPSLDWTYGMFGENLTVSEFDEADMLIGDIYKVGEAILQVSQPRQPCNKFAAKFGATNVIEQFIEFGHSGVYFRVIQAGHVRVGDEFILDLRNQNALSVWQIYQLLFSMKNFVNPEHARKAINDPNLANSAKKDIHRHWKI